MEVCALVGAALLASTLLHRAAERKGSRITQAVSSQQAPLVTIRSFNLLSAGYDEPFRYYVPATNLDWPRRRDVVLAALLAPAPGSASPPDLLSVQELQSSTRGWGRQSGGGASADHASWLRLMLGRQGYVGAYCNTEHDPRSSKSEAACDAPLVAKARARDSHEWPVPTSCGLGARLGVALFWRRTTWAHVATREIPFSSHFYELTKALGNKAAWEALGSAHVALLVLLRQRSTGALLVVGTVHMPLPAFKAPNPGARQVQFAAALAAEVDALLEPLGLASRVPVLIAGDFNMQPQTAAHALLTKGALPEGALHATVALPYPANTVVAPFTSAYAAAAGGAEPAFTTFRRCRDDETGAEKAPFIGCLDYILARNPSAAGSASLACAVAADEAAAPASILPPLASLVLHAVAPLPTLETIRAGSTGAMPSDEHPSDHLPIAAAYTLHVTATKDM